MSLPRLAMELRDDEFARREQLFHPLEPLRVERENDSLLQRVPGLKDVQPHEWLAIFLDDLRVEIAATRLKRTEFMILHCRPLMFVFFQT